MNIMSRRSAHLRTMMTKPHLQEEKEEREGETEEGKEGGGVG